jgi:hypothetical protein
MSEVRLNIRDTNRAIHGAIHGAVADAAIAALSAEPETIGELEAALERFIRPLDDRRPFGLFHAGANEEAWDAKIVVVDLAARIVASESSYSASQAQGEIRYHDGTKATDVSLLYRVPDDWLFVNSLGEYKSVRGRRRAQRAATPPVDARQVLYGASVIEFIVNEIRNPQSSIENLQFEDAVARIHARWLMTPRADLRGQTPREVMLAKLDFIDFDLHTRELQWSMLEEGPPPLARESFAYRFAGFGTHEFVLYYDLLRHLLSECWGRRESGNLAHSATFCESDTAAESSRLTNVKEVWLSEPQRELQGRIPLAIIESERRRIPLVMSAKSMMIDENCDLCQMLASETGEGMGPAFWHLDGCNMDQGFEFSFHRTRAEWEEAERRRKEFDEEFAREWAERDS